MELARTRRAIGIVRVSQVNGREGDSFASPGEQRERIRAACERDGLRLLDVIDELDVSGGTALADRAGLRRAVEAVEAGDADVIVAAYFDRLVRSLRVQDELVSRVEHAGGQVLALDTGQVTNGSAGQWLSGTMLGAVAEYARRTAAERSAEAQARAVARGVLPWPNVPPGYVRGDDGVLVPDPARAGVVRQAFKRRADGATVADVRAFLASRGIDRSYHGTTSLLASRVMLGEIHFGNLVNLTAHEPIVDRELWQRVQRASAPRGRRAKSDRLLARLGVLRCASCGARMVVGSANNRQYAIYRCPPTGDCPRRVSISAEIAEAVVVQAAREWLAGFIGVRAARENVRAVRAAAAAAQADLDTAVRSFAVAGLADEPAASERLAELRQARDQARDQAEALDVPEDEGELLRLSADWDKLAPVDRRRGIRAAIKRAVVQPADRKLAPADRVTVEYYGVAETFARGAKHVPLDLS